MILRMTFVVWNTDAVSHCPHSTAFCRITLWFRDEINYFLDLLKMKYFQDFFHLNILIDDNNIMKPQIYICSNSVVFCIHSRHHIHIASYIVTRRYTSMLRHPLCAMSVKSCHSTVGFLLYLRINVGFFHCSFITYRSKRGLGEWFILISVILFCWTHTYTAVFLKRLENVWGPQIF